MQLSPHFSLEELIVTQVRGLDNTPSQAVIETLADTAERMEAVRELLGQPIIVTSGYRSVEVNRHIGGVPGSAHTTGHAVDFICPAFGTPLEVAQAIHNSSIDLDQLILEEDTWTHISFDPQMRNQTLTKHRGSSEYIAGIILKDGTRV